MLIAIFNSLHSEIGNTKDNIHTAEKAQETDAVNLENKSVITSPISPQAPTKANNHIGRVHTRKEERSGNTLYQELSFQVSAFKLVFFFDVLYKKLF